MLNFMSQRLLRLKLELFWNNIVLKVTRDQALSLAASLFVHGKKIGIGLEKNSKIRVWFQCLIFWMGKCPMRYQGANQNWREKMDRKWEQSHIISTDYKVICRNSEKLKFGIYLSLQEVPQAMKYMGVLFMLTGESKKCALWAENGELVIAIEEKTELLDKFKKEDSCNSTLVILKLRNILQQVLQLTRASWFEFAANCLKLTSCLKVNQRNVV